MKNAIKKLILLFLYLTIGKRKENNFIILTYHRVTDNLNYLDPLKVSIDNFEKQIKYLKKYYTIISGEDLLNSIKNSQPLPDKACLITFDDGWRDNYTNAFPILKKYNIPVIIFISTGYIGTNDIFWHEELQEILINIPTNVISDKLDKLLGNLPYSVGVKISEIIKSEVNERQNKINNLITLLKSYDLDTINKINNDLKLMFPDKKVKKPLMLTWQQVKEMSKNNISFGSHTQSHAILTQISEDEIIKELNESKYALEKYLEKPIYYFSYPNGNYNEKTKKQVKEAGYIAAFAMLRGIIYSKNDLFEIKRNMITEQSSTGINGKFSELFFKIELSGIRNRIKHWNLIK